MRLRMTSKRERQKANKAERLERERKDAKRSRQLQLLRRGAIIAAIVIGGGILFSVFFGNDDPPETTVPPTSTTSGTAATTTTAPTDGSTVPPTTAASAPVIPTDYDGFRAQPTACGAEQPPPVVEMAFAEPVDQGLTADSTAIATISTSCGDIVIELATAESPETVNSFVFLAGEGYFDGSASHRVVPGFVMQAGDPTATGTGGPGYVIPDEFPEGDGVYERGVVAMANAGAGTTGSQFFVVSSDAGLPPQFNILGRVIEGMDVVDTISQVQLGPNRQGEVSVPLESVYLNQVTVEVS